MKVVIIEDEVMAAELIESLVLKYDSTIEILEILDSIKASAAWFNVNSAPDLVFMDIHLADGLSFEIFDQTQINCPIIFTTAYNEYAIRAFKVNSIDYLLKPLDFDELKQAIDKYKERFSEKPQIPSPDVFDKVLNMLTNKFKQRFVIKVGEHIRSIPVEDVLYFYSLEKATFLHTANNHNYVIDYSIEQLEGLVDPEKFFRINRKYLIAMNSFDDIISYSNSRLKIELLHSDEYDVIVSREKVQKFKKWLDK
jgi:DNA-binding LytR/AlgR family response regulator